MDFGIYAADTDKTIYLHLRDSTTGLAKTGLVFNSAGAVCSYTLPLAARAAITLATQTVTGAHSDGGFVEVDATNCKGLYRLDLPDAAIASGAFTVISIEFDGTIEESIEIPLHIRKVNVTQLGSDAQSATDLKDFADAGYDPGTNKVQGVVLTDTVTTLTNLPAITADWLTATGIAADAITAAKIANGAIDAATFAADVDAEILSYLVDDATRIDASSLNTASVTSIPAILADTGTDGVVVAAASKTGYTLSQAGLAAFITQDTGTTYASVVAGSVVNEIVDNFPGSSSPTVSEIADGVWDELIAGHAISGSTGEALSAAGGAGDPWITALPGAYSSGQAGFILGTNLNATVSSRSSHAAADVWAVGTRTLSSGAIVAATFGAGAIDAAAIANGAIDAATFAADVDAEILSYIVDDATRIDASALNTASGNVTTILADTNELQSDWADGGRLDLILDTILIDTGELQVDWTDSGRLDMLIDAIKAKTDLIPASPAEVGSAMTLTTGERDAIAAALLDLADAIETGITVRKLMRAMGAKTAGLISGAGTGTEVLKGLGQASGGTTRLTATVDGSGNITDWTVNL